MMPPGKTLSATSIRTNRKVLLSSEVTTKLNRFMATPTIRPPIMLPGRLEKPPSTAAAKDCSMNAATVVELRKVLGMMSNDAITPSVAAAPHASPWTA
ncbi:MAG: hypothetical protein JWO24_1871 [Rhodospirillales bacterium]|jgi:hypothetical protein|nr:hypothetical protein [Rhodospirillales bacterium]